MPDPNNTAHFWLTWSVQVIAAFGTISAVLVALFGQGFRAKFFPPTLSLELVNPEGEKTNVRLTWAENGEAKERFEEARYYHLRVSNHRRWSPANHVYVALLRVEEPGPDEQYRTTWVGDVPLGWRHQEVFSTQRTIGPRADVDLCSVVKDKWLQIHPLVTPFNLQVTRRDPTRIVLILQARSDEADSQLIRIEVLWNGKWHGGAKEMQENLIIKTSKPTAA